MNFLVKLKDMDRRIVFVFVALAVAVPIIFKMDFPVFPGRSVLGLKNFIDGLPAGERVFLSFDFDPASMPELQPAAIAILVHLFRRGVKPVCGANWPVGGDMAEAALAEAVALHRDTFEKAKSDGVLANASKKDLVSGTDYINLGYKPGAIIHVKAIVADFLGPYPVDKDGNSTSHMPIFQNENDRRFAISDIGIIISFTAGTGGIEAFINVAGEHKRPMAAGCTSVNIPRFYTYLQTKQLVGMTGGLPGAAEYEKLIDYLGPARYGIAPQSVAHMVIIGFIILGNIAFLAERAKSDKKPA